MSPEEFKNIRIINGLSQTKFGLSLGIPQNTISDYENGKSEIPKTVEILIEYRYLKKDSLPIVGPGDKEKDKIENILDLLRQDPEGMDAVFHFLEAKKNFDRASKAMKQYLGKKLEVWFEFPSAGNGEPKGKGGPK